MNKIKYYYSKLLKLCSTEGLIVLAIAAYYGNVNTAFIALVLGLILQLIVICSDSRTNRMYFTGTRKQIFFSLIYFIFGTGIKSLFLILSSNLNITNKCDIAIKIIIIFIVMPLFANYLLLQNSNKL
jgi:hypothetical protein